MFYVNKSIRLISRCNAYLELIQQSNNRYEDKRSLLARYDACRDMYAPIKLMNTRYQIIEQMERWETLSNWLVIRYQTVFTKLGEENLNQLRKQVSNNKVSTIEL